MLLKLMMILLMLHKNMEPQMLWKFAQEGAGYFKDERIELKRKLYRAVANVNILEGIRFYVSFACSFAFGELKLMEGSAKIISLIARDENQHLVITQNILNKWREGDDPEMQQIAKEEESWVIVHLRSVSMKKRVG
jgi:ribonucleotide reductase beta subunit family protein with ferritin-like domain